jgi:hypothetical protein
LLVRADGSGKHHVEAAATAGLAKPRLPLELEPLRAAFGGTPNLRTRYRAFIKQIDERDEVELAGLEPATSWVRSRRSPN